MTAGWRSMPLGELCQFQAGGAFPQSEQGHIVGDYPFIKVSDMTLPANSKRIVAANNWVTDETAKRMKVKLAPAGSVAFAKIGEGLKAERLRQITRPTAMDNNMMAAIPKRGSVDERFLLFLLESVRLSSWAEGSALPYLRQKDLAAIPVTVPSLPEQRDISATLGTLDDKIESNLRSIDLIDQLVRARFDRDFDIEISPTGTALSDLIDVNVRRKLSRGSEATYVGMSALPEFSPTVYNWDIRAFGTGQKFVNGDVLMARITPCLENGKTAIVDMLDDGEVGWGSTEYIVLSPSGAFTTPWIYALARNDILREWAIRRMTGSSGRQRFQASGFDEYRIGEPSQQALSAFNSFAMPLFDRMTSLRDETRRLTALRDALLPELLSGRISPTELKGQSG